MNLYGTKNKVVSVPYFPPQMINMLPSWEILVNGGKYWEILGGGKYNGKFDSTVFMAFNNANTNQTTY